MRKILSEYDKDNIKLIGEDFAFVKFAGKSGVAHDVLRVDVNDEDSGIPRALLGSLPSA